MIKALQHNQLYHTPSLKSTWEAFPPKGIHRVCMLPSCQQEIHNKPASQLKDWLNSRCFYTFSGWVSGEISFKTFDYGIQLPKKFKTSQLRLVVSRFPTAFHCDLNAIFRELSTPLQKKHSRFLDWSRRGVYFLAVKSSQIHLFVNFSQIFFLPETCLPAKPMLERSSMKGWR